MRWADLTAAHPEFAAQLEAALRRHRHCVLGTVRPDGSPRLSGIEAWFWNGDLMLGMMAGSRKAADLDRDSRFELHSAPHDTELGDPDARVRGRAERVTDPDEIEAFADWLPHETDAALELFRARVSGTVLTRVEGDRLILESWRPGIVLRRHFRT